MEASLPAFTPYGAYALMILTPSWGVPPCGYIAAYSAWEFDRHANAFTALLQGALPGTFLTQEEARAAGLAAAQDAVDGLLI